MMGQLSFEAWEQIQLDNEAYPNHVLIYKNGKNYCTYNKSAMQLIYYLREHLYVIEYMDLSNSNILIKITFSSEAFECLKKKYHAIVLPPGHNHLPRWLICTQHVVSDYNYYIWSGILNIELRMSSKSKSIKCEHETI